MDTHCKTRPQSSWVREQGFRYLLGLISLIALLLASGNTSAEQKTPRQIADAAAKAVVGITAITQWGDELSTGSGFFVDSRGTFVTNFHVIEDGYSLVIELPSGEKLTKVFVVYESEEHDLALLKVDAGMTNGLPLSMDHEMHPGDTVYVMGNPLGQDRTFSNGIVSANRIIDGVRHLQITAPISAGSSGGPVMDSSGQVVGVAVATFEGGQNLNLAVPVSYIRRQIENPPVATPFQGKRIQPVAVHAAPPPGRILGQPRIELRGDDWEGQVRDQLRAMDREAKREGFIRSHEEYITDLNDWSNALISVTLERGVKYLIGAACDEDCTDIDLFVYDGSDRLVAEESEVTATPVIEFMPRATGPHFIRVRMFDCHSEPEPCTVGVLVWRMK